MNPTPFDTVTTDQTSVFCDGDAGTSGHPRVFLHMETGVDRVICPYCSRMFLHAGHDEYKHSERAVAAPVTGKPVTPLDLEKAH